MEKDVKILIDEPPRPLLSEEWDLLVKGQCLLHCNKSISFFVVADPEKKHFDNKGSKTSYPSFEGRMPDKREKHQKPGDFYNITSESRCVYSTLEYFMCVCLWLGVLLYKVTY